MPCPLNGLRHLLLVFYTCACNPSREYFALFVHKLEQEIRVFIVNILNAVLFKPAVCYPFIVSVDRFVFKTPTSTSSLDLLVLFNSPFLFFSLYALAVLSKAIV